MAESPSIISFDDMYSRGPFIKIFNILVHNQAGNFGNLGKAGI